MVIGDCHVLELPFGDLLGQGHLCSGACTSRVAHIVRYGIVRDCPSNFQSLSYRHRIEDDIVPLQTKAFLRRKAFMR